MRSSMIPIAYFENRYLIGPDGAILNLANNTLLTPIENPNGYFKVGLATGKGTHKQVSVHVLVAKHFIPNPYDHPQVNHKDGDKSNNSVDNLEWVTHSENIQHALRTGLRPGYMSADEKESLMYRVLAGEQVKDLAVETGRRPETLHKMLRETAKRLNIHDRWVAQMKENRRAVARRNLKKTNP